MREPQVIVGARSNVADPPPPIAAGLVPYEATVAPIPEGKVVFLSKSRNYILNLGGTVDTFDHKSGRVIYGKSWRLVFDNFRAVVDPATEDAEEIVARAKKVAAYGKDFWDVADLRKHTAEMKVAQTRSYLESLKAEDPEQFEKLVMEQIDSGGGFKLPEKAKKQ